MTERTNDFFVMLNHPSGRITPLVDGNDWPVMYPTLEAATAAGESSLLGHGYGFEVFERGMGEA